MCSSDLYCTLVLKGFLTDMNTRPEEANAQGQDVTSEGVGGSLLLAIADGRLGKTPQEPQAGRTPESNSQRRAGEPGCDPVLILFSPSPSCRLDSFQEHEVNIGCPRRSLPAQGVDLLFSRCRNSLGMLADASCCRRLG